MDRLMVPRLCPALHAGFIRGTNVSGIFMLRCSLLAMRVCVRCDVGEMLLTDGVVTLRKKFLPENRNVIGRRHFSTYPFVFSEKP